VPDGMASKRLHFGLFAQILGKAPVASA
jgi:hypothetical protein